MSKHWNPGDELDRARGERAKTAWPQGATIGLAIVAAACLSTALLLYKLAGPRDIFTP